MLPKNDARRTLLLSSQIWPSFARLLVVALIPTSICAFPQSQPTLQITSPSGRTVVNPGQTLTVSVTSPTPAAFTEVDLYGDKLGFVGTFSSLPGQISVTIPSSRIACGSYFLTVSGNPTSGQEPVSAIVELDVERSDFPLTISADLSPLIFDSAGEQVPLRLLAGFADGTTFSVNASSYVTYSSSNTAVATVDSTGLVTAVAPGSGSIAVTYALGSNNNQIFIPVSVPNPVNTAPPAPTIVVSPVNSSIICGSAVSTITKTAVVLSNGLPVVGTTVTFTITGPDSGKSGTAITNPSGAATFTVTAPLLTSSAGDTVVATVNGGTVISNTTFATCSGSTSGSFCSTAPSPTVTLMSVITGPPVQVVLSVQSTGGLSSVVVDTPPTANATVAISPFDNGTTQAMGVTATKIDQSASSVVALTVTDLCGHTTVFDPVFATITIPVSNSLATREFNFNHREGSRFGGIDRTEGIVLLQNDTPGVDSLVIRVNGSEFRTRLADGETKRINISSALHQGSNTVTIVAAGRPNSSVDLSISDGK